MLNLETLECGFLFKKMVDCGHGVYKLDFREAIFVDDGTPVPLVRDFGVGQELLEYCGDTVNVYKVSIVHRADAWVLIMFNRNYR